jgi:hypothetical protein
MRLWTSFKALAEQQVAHRLGLIVTVLEQQPATGVQMLRRLGDDQAQIVQAIDPPPGHWPARSAHRLLPGAGRRRRCRAGC